MFGETQYDGNVLRLAPGDMVLFSTDGLFEAQGTSGEQFGEARMLELCAQNRDTAPEELLASILDAVDGFGGDCAQHDDVTALALKVK
jgi:sigma-B regulation protein RsbU (phosphoserine phosphatase)